MEKINEEVVVEEVIVEENLIPWWRTALVAVGGIALGVVAKVVFDKVTDHGDEDSKYETEYTVITDGQEDDLVSDEEPLND